MNLKPVTILIPESTLEIIRQESIISGVPRGINLRNVIVRHYERKYKGTPPLPNLEGEGRG